MVETTIEQLSTRSVAPGDASALDCLVSIPNQYISLCKQLENKASALYLFDKIKNIPGHIVMVGANGSGKSTFSRQLRGKISQNSLTILSAQHLLTHSPLKSIPAANDEIKKVRDFQNDDKLSNASNFVSLLQTDMNQLITALIAQHTDCALAYYNDRGSRESSTLEKLTDIWSEMIAHRTIEIERNGISIKASDGPGYPFNNLSDGEKAVFYYIGHILLARESFAFSDL